MGKDAYKRAEKWWLGLVVLFYLLYNLPGVPPFGDAVGALWHGALTIIPLWIVIYVGLFRLNSQRKLSADAEKPPVMDVNSSDSDKEVF